MTLVHDAVLLDHGVYKEFDEDFRVRYCQLWKALILLDSNKILQLGEQYGVGKYARFFPLIFTGRTIDRLMLLISRATLLSGCLMVKDKSLRLNQLCISFSIYLFCAELRRCYKFVSCLFYFEVFGLGIGDRLVILKNFHLSYLN